MGILVARGEARPPVHPQQDQVGLLDGLQGLARDQGVEPVLALREPAGVDHDPGPGADARAAVLAVAREAGLVRDEGLARSGQVVEQRRLAHVRPADDGDDRDRAFRHDVPSLAKKGHSARSRERARQSPARSASTVPLRA